MLLLLLCRCSIALAVFYPLLALMRSEVVETAAKALSQLPR